MGTDIGRLTYAKAKSLQNAGLYGDGGTLFLKVQVRNGHVTKSWVQRVTVRGRRRDIGLGAFPLVSLAEARELAFDIRRLARRGEDPRPRAVPTFREATERTYKALRPRWRSKKTADRWLRTMESHAYPRLAEMPVDLISRADVLDMLTPLWTEKPGIARKLRQSIKATFQWARAKGYLDDNPAGEAIDGALPRVRSAKAHYRALDYREVGAVLETIAECNASLAARACLQFVILTACRNGEARGANWAEMNLQSCVWRIPASRMKNQREHRVPLSEAAVGVLGQARVLDDGSGLVFPSPVRRGRQMSDMTLTKVLRDTGLAERATVHGFRSTFRQWASECTDADHAVMELCLAHMIGSETERAYARSDLLAKRRRLMERWAQYATGAVGNLTTQKSFYVEISRARDRAELVTDDAGALKEQLEAVTGERISALEGIGEKSGPGSERDGKASPGLADPERESVVESSPVVEIEQKPVQEKAAEPEPPVHEMDYGMELEM